MENGSRIIKGKISALNIQEEIDLFFKEFPDQTGYILTKEDDDLEKNLLTITLFDLDSGSVLLKVDNNVDYYKNLNLLDTTDIDQMLDTIMHPQHSNKKDLIQEVINLNTHATFKGMSFGWNSNDFVENQITVTMYFSFVI